MTSTLTALFADRSTAERAVERLHAAGVPERCIEMHQADEGDFVSQDTASRGLFSLEQLVAPDDRAAEAMQRRTVVVATGVPGDLSGEARRILAEDALDVHADRATGGDVEGDEGAIGSLGGQGRATQDVDRLTGQPTGAAAAPHDRDAEHGIGGGGSATGSVDRLTGRPTTTRNG
jgi:hypothetical protein